MAIFPMGLNQRSKGGSMIKLPATVGGIIFLLVLGALIFIGGPLATIWALNTLFPSLAIPFTIETWLAAFIIPAAFKTELTTKKD